MSYNMKITKSFLIAISDLFEGKSVAVSKINSNLTQELVNDGYIIIKTNGSRRMMMAQDVERLKLHLISIVPELADLESLKNMINQSVNRADQASLAGNSKIKAYKPFHGFAVNSLQPVYCSINDKELVVNPVNGTFLFIENWEEFHPEEDVVVIGIENMENFSKIRNYGDFFLNYIRRKLPGKSEKILFVSRLLSSNDLRKWLQMIPNQYIHFGDFDLPGIKIFLTEFYSILGNKASFLIPEDIEKRLKNGSHLRYNQHYPFYKNLKSDLPYVQDLINLIHTYGRCYDQEGYIKNQ